MINIGTDIVNIQRIERLFEKFGNDFLLKNFHDLEIKQFNLLTDARKIGYLAKRFAAKEAISKALGSGIGRGLAFKDIAIINDEYGAPKVEISLELHPGFREYDFQISLSDDYPFAVAFAMISS